MLIGFQGNLGGGKTQGMTVFAEFLHHKTGVPLYSNYALKGAIRINKMSQLWDIQGGIVAIDEIWINMDARLWKDNVTFTRLINFSRKKQMLILYTTQHIRQVELRVRNATDILIMCEKVVGGTWYSFIDWQNRLLLRRFFLDRPERFWGLYNTYEIVEPITMDYNPGKQPDGFRQPFKKAFKKYEPYPRQKGAYKRTEEEPD